MYYQALYFQNIKICHLYLNLQMNIDSQIDKALMVKCLQLFKLEL